MKKYCLLPIAWLKKIVYINNNHLLINLADEYLSLKQSPFQACIQAFSFHQQTHPVMNIAVIIYAGVELVDMHGPLDVFLHVNAILNDRYHIYTIAETVEPVASEGGVVTILPTYSFVDCPEPDVLIVPGLLDQQLSPTVASAACIGYIKKLMQKQKIILSVCVGLLNVAATDMLDGKKVTTHYLAIKQFQNKHPKVRVIKNVRVIEDGKLVSTGGVTSGIDGALHLVHLFDGDAVAQQVADLMVYNRRAPLPEYTLLPPYETE